MFIVKILLLLSLISCSLLNKGTKYIRIKLNSKGQIIGEYTEQLVFDNITFYDDDSDNTHTHIFQYSALNSSTHSINCRCGYSSVGNHTFELNKLNSIVTDPQYIPSYVCSFCGYTTNRLPTIL